MRTALTEAASPAHAFGMTEQAIDEILARYRDCDGSLLPVLHAVQAAFGHIPEAAVPVIAQALNLSRAEVHGVVSFYHDFRTEPEQRPVIKLCRAEACQARGVESLLADLPSQDRVAIESVYCLGLCSAGPAALVGERAVARLDALRLAGLIAELA